MVASATPVGRRISHDLASLRQRASTPPMPRRNDAMETWGAIRFWRDVRECDATEFSRMCGSFVGHLARSAATIAVVSAARLMTRSDIGFNSTLANAPARVWTVLDLCSPRNCFIVIVR